MHVNANFRHKVWKFRKLTSGKTEGLPTSMRVKMMMDG